jgi:phosphoglycolate phosphatase
MNKNIFFDLDGTLIDPRIRLYNLFVELVPECKFSFDEYWEIKRNGINQAKLLNKYFNYSEEQVIQFRKLWLSKIEDKERLKQDVPFSKSRVLLEKLSKDNDVFIVTERQKKDLVFWQIRNYGWNEYLKKILATMQKTSKFTIISENVSVTKHDIIVGDTGEDILTGKKLGIRTIGVTSGLLNKKILSEYDPDLIISNADAILEQDEYAFKPLHKAI